MRTNIIKYIQSALIITTFFSTSIAYSAAHSWVAHASLTSAFAAIPITVVLLTGSQTINHTSIETCTDTLCNAFTGGSINVGSPPVFTFTTSTTYFLGLSAYTSDFFSANTHSIKVSVNADGGAFGSVCIPITCSSNTNCVATSGPFLLVI